MKKLTQEDFLKASIESHGDRYDYSKSVFSGSQKYIIVTCRKHGDFLQRATTHMHGVGCLECHQEMFREIRHHTLESFIDKAKEVHGNKYNYDKITEYKNNSTKVMIECDMHGFFLQSPASHLSGKGCAGCQGKLHQHVVALTQDEFEARANRIHNNKYNYSQSKYISRLEMVDIICPIHGKFTQKGNEHLSGYGCKECGKLEIHLKKDIKFKGKHPLYGTWIHVRERCNKPNHPSYERYGGKGITISKEFDESFQAFSEYLMSLPNFERKFSEGWSLDRINPYGNYERGNLRWADVYTQAKNKKVWAKSGFEGIVKVGDKYKVMIAVNVGRFDTLQEAIDERNYYIVDHDLPNSIREYDKNGKHIYMPDEKC